MARMTESQTRRLARCYCRSLCRLYGTDRLSHEEMEAIVGDLAALREYADLPIWSQLGLLPAPRLESGLRDICARHSLSPHTAEWLLSFARRGHTRAIGRSLREMESFIVRVVIQVPEYVPITDERMRLARRNIQEYYRRHGMESFVEIGIQRIPSQPMDPSMVSLVTDVFDATLRSLTRAG